MKSMLGFDSGQLVLMGFFSVFVIISNYGTATLLLLFTIPMVAMIILNLVVAVRFRGRSKVRAVYRFRYRIGGNLRRFEHLLA